MTWLPIVPTPVENGLNDPCFLYQQQQYSKYQLSFLIIMAATPVATLLSYILA